MGGGVQLIKIWPLVSYATFSPAAGSWNWTYRNLFYNPRLTYSLKGSRASLSVDDPSRAALPNTILDWTADGSPSASSYRYEFESKNILQVNHYIGHVHSDSVKFGFASAVDLDECLSGLPRGEGLLKAIKAANSRLGVAG